MGAGAVVSDDGEDIEEGGVSADAVGSEAAGA